MKKLDLYSLPLSASLLRLRFGKEIKTLDLFRLLLLETVHGRVEIEKQHESIPCQT
jgi:hypothetical protein